MWERRDLKDNAKDMLRKFYWQAFLVALVMMIVGGISIVGPFGSSGSNSGGDGNSQNNTTINSDFTPDLNTVMPNMPFVNFENGAFQFPDLSSPSAIGSYIWLAIAGAAFFFIIAFFVWRIFLGYPVEVGCRKFFLNATEETQEYNNMTFCFKNDVYWNVVKTMFLRSLFNFLWYFALIIPGIIKSFAYRMVPYILADNPNMPYDEAINLSQDMTRGHKFNMFVLDLSFIGWYLLGLILCGMGGVFVNPYYLATNAELYLVLRTAAIEKGLCLASELNVLDGTETQF